MATTTIDWEVLLPVLVSALAPTITGFLQQFSAKFSETAPWYYKGLVTTAIAALIGVVTSYAAQGDALVGLTAGAVVGSIGSVNIALRKGAGRYFNVELQPPSAPAQKIDK